MKDYNLGKLKIAQTDISDVIIHKNYQFDLFALEFPLFSLKLDKKTLEYEFTSKNGTIITIRNTNLGRATIQDADLWLYCITKMMQLIYEEKTLTRRVTFIGYDFLKRTGRVASNSNYNQITKSLQRLASTRLETNRTIETWEIGAGIGLLDSYEYIKDRKTGKVIKIEVILPEWLFAEIVSKKITTINPQYLELKPLEKRIYQIAKIHCRKDSFNNVFNLEYLAKKVGSFSTVELFRFKIKKMQEIQPQMQEIRNKYKNDQQKMMQETQKLQKEMGFNPLAGCLPILVQMPVFLGLYHVLRSFNRTGTGAGQLGLTPEQNRMTPNYFFSAEDVQSFLDARLFKVPLSAYISMPESMYQAFPGDFTKTNIIMLAAPLVVIIVVAIHMNARLSVDRQKARIASGKQKPAANDQMQMQADMMNKMMLWFLPGTILLTCTFWHIGLLFYMVSNNVWTFFQQRWVFKLMDTEEEAELQAKKDAKRASAPKVGQKPTDQNKKKKRKR